MSQPMRLIRGERETRQEKMLREIRERRTGENVPQGEGEIDNMPCGNYVAVDEVLAKSFKYEIAETSIPRWRRVLKRLGILCG